MLIFAEENNKKKERLWGYSSAIPGEYLHDMSCIRKISKRTGKRSSCPFSSLLSCRRSLLFCYNLISANVLIISDLRKCWGIIPWKMVSEKGIIPFFVVRCLSFAIRCGWIGSTVWMLAKGGTFPCDLSLHRVFVDSFFALILCHWELVSAYQLSGRSLFNRQKARKILIFLFVWNYCSTFANINSGVSAFCLHSPGH